MKQMFMLLMMLIIASPIFSQKKSEQFILFEPTVKFIDLTKLPVYTGSIGSEWSETGKLYHDMQKVTSDPLGFSRRDRTFEPTKIDEIAKTKRNELRELASWDNFKKYRIIKNPEKYTHEDIHCMFVIQAEMTTKQSLRGSGITCYVLNGDTLVVNKINQDRDGYGILKTKITQKFNPHITFRQYVSNLGLTDKLQSKVNETTEQWKCNLDFSQRLMALSNEVAELNKEDVRLYELALNKRQELEQEEREEQVAEDNRRRIVGDMEYEFIEPTGPIQTKSITNPFGAKVTYQYYVNENGYEVKHGKMTTTMTFKDHKYYADSNHGFIHITGTETLTVTYRNEILHGPLTYKCNANTDSTFGNPEDINRTYNLNIYKGFLTGNFKFEYNGITYTGKAVNGILEYCNYQTNDGFHGKITSNPNSKSISVAEINNGNKTFEFDSNIALPSIIAVMPSFRFPLIGNNN